MKMGIIGLGNMGSAMAHGLLNNNIETFLYDRNLEKREAFKDFEKAKIMDSEVDVVKNADAVILTVKPYVYDEVLDKIKEAVKNQENIVAGQQSLVDVAQRELDTAKTPVANEEHDLNRAKEEEKQAEKNLAEKQKNLAKAK